MIEREKLARENVERFLIEEEDRRKKFEDQINEKSKIINIYFQFIYLLKETKK